MRGESVRSYADISIEKAENIKRGQLGKPMCSVRFSSPSGT